jgi:hypothetical protein
MPCCRSNSEKEATKPASALSTDHVKEAAAAPAKTDAEEKSEPTKKRDCGCQC